MAYSSQRALLRFLSLSLVALYLSGAASAEESPESLIVFSPDSAPDGAVRTALQNAIDKAIALDGPVTLRIEPGLYRLEVARTEDRPYALQIHAAAGLKIEAEGAEFLVANPVAGFLKIRDSSDFFFRGGVIDYDPLPFSAGRVTSVATDRRSLVVDPLPGYPRPDHWQFSEARGWGYFLDTEVPGKLADGTPNVVFDQSVETLPDGRFRYRFERPLPPVIAEGADDLLFVRIIKTAQLIFASNSRRLHFEGITSYASPSGHYVANNCEDIAILGCRALIRPGRVKGGNADGVHQQNTRGPIRIEDCAFVGISDDGVNLYQKPHHILERIDATLLRISAEPKRQVQRPGSGAFREGDRVSAFDDTTGNFSGPVEVLSFDRKSGILRLARPLELPEDPDALARTSLYGDGFANRSRIADSLFADSRRFGIYLKAPNAEVLRNRFLRLSSSAIVAMNDTGHGEGLGTQHLLVANNRIENCGFSLNWANNPHLQAISIFAQLRPHRVVDIPGFHRDITIRNNIIRGVSRGFFLQSIEGLHLEDNWFQPLGQETPGPVPIQQSKAEP